MIANIRRDLPASGIRKVFDRAQELERAGRRILHLEIGRPHWSMPPGVEPAAGQALGDGFVHYVANRGLLELREAVAADIEARTGHAYDPERQLIVTTGASEGLAMCALALLGPGDEMLIPEPAWPHYRASALMAGAKPVSVPLDHRNGFVLDPDRIRECVSDKTRLLVVNSPANPTGAVQPRNVLAELAALACERGFTILSDEVYQDFVYGDACDSMAGMDGMADHLVLLNSLSKSYAMTGWRIGYVAANTALSDAMNRVHQYLTVCGVSFAQKGAVALFRHPAIETYRQEMREAFRLRQQVWTKAFQDLPNATVKAPQGAFYLFPRITYRGMPGDAFCEYMLEKHGVAMVPGAVFGDAYRDFVRISYGRDLADQEEAAQILLHALSE